MPHRRSSRFFFQGSKTEPILMRKTPLTPLPQHGRPKNDSEFEIFSKSLLFLYRNIRSEKVNTAFKKLVFPPNPPQQHRRQKNDINFEKLSDFSSSAVFTARNAKRAPASFQKQTLFFVFSFTSSAGSAARSRPPWACRRPAAYSGRPASRWSAAGARRHRAPKSGLFYTART